jgi:hypothetical protein
MNINYKSWHAWLYRTLLTTEKMPKSLCEYFWKLVALILTLPLYIAFNAPYYFTRFIEGVFSIFFTTKNTFLDKNEKNEYWMRAVISIVLYAIIFCITSMMVGLYSLFFTGLTVYPNISIIGIIIWVFVIGATITHIIYKIKDKNPDTLVHEYIKAKYNKYCPKITWDNTPDETEQQ